MKRFTVDREYRWDPLAEEIRRETEASAIRNAEVERGRKLAADSTYPPFEICEEVAQKYISSSDF